MGMTLFNRFLFWKKKKLSKEEQAYEVFKNIDIPRFYSPPSKMYDDMERIPLEDGSLFFSPARSEIIMDEDASGKVEIKMVPTQKGYKTVTFTLTANHGKVFAENCIGGEVHQYGNSFKVEHERE